MFPTLNDLNSIFRMGKGRLPVQFEEITRHPTLDAFEVRLWLGRDPDPRKKTLFRAHVKAEDVYSLARVDGEGLLRVVTRPLQALRDLYQEGYDEGVKRGIEEGKRQVRTHFQEVGKLQSLLPRG